MFSMKKVIDRVCYLDTVYSLLLYILICNKQELNNTLFIFTDRMPVSILNKIKNKIVFKYVFSSDQVKYQKYRFLNKLKLYPYKFSKNCNFFGNDRLCYSHFFVKKGNFTVIEDGTMNYNLDYFKSMNIRYEKTSYLKAIYRKIFWSLYEGANHKFLGLDSRVKKVILTGILPIPEVIKNKTVVKNFLELWNDSENKDFILNLFELDKQLLITGNTIENLLLTQPLNLPAQKLINVYKWVINKYNNVIIKTHPREDIDYSKIFPNNIIIDAPFPIQLFSALNIKIERVITISSTAALSLKSDKTELVWLGDRINNLI